MDQQDKWFLKKCAAKWIEQLLTHQPRLKIKNRMLFLLKQLARKTDHRELNLSESIIQKILTAYPQDHLKEWLLEEKH